MKRRLIHILPYAALLALVIGWWLPGGLGMSPILDDWTLLMSASRGELPLFHPAAAPTRPLTYVPWVVAWALTPESFVGLNGVMLALHWLKGAALFALLRRIVPAHPAFCWMAAALFTVFPADHGIFYPGIANIHWAVALALLAVNALVAYWHTPTVARLLLMYALLVPAVLTYEAGIPLLLCAPALLLLLEGRCSRRFWRVSALWAAFPAAWLGYFVYAIVSGAAAYQASLLDRSADRWSLLDGIAYMYHMNYVRGFQFGAEAAWNALIGALPWAVLPVGALIGVGAALMAWRMDRRQNAARARWWVWIIGGAAATLIGFALYIPARDFSTQHYTWRLSMFTAVGASAAIAAALMLLPRRLVYGAAGVVIALAAWRGLAQHQVFLAWSADQLGVLRAAAQIAHTPPDGTLIAIIDASSTEFMRTFRLNYVWEHALSLLYNTPAIHGRVCYDDATSPRPNESCRFEDGALVVPGVWSGMEMQSIPYQRLIVFRYTDADHLTLLETIPPAYLNGADASAYDPAALIHPGSALPARYFTMFAPR